MPRNVMDRFWEKIDISQEDDCLHWIGGKGHNGYGMLCVNGKMVYAHRYIWEETNGPIMSGMFIDHICRNRACINTFHMRVVTPRINALENSISKAALFVVRDRCKQGHVYTKESTYIYRGSRMCKTCSEDRRKGSGYKDKARERGKSYWSAYYQKRKEKAASEGITEYEMRKRDRSIRAAEVA